MALKTKKPVAKNRKKRKTKTSFFKNEKFRFILGILVLLMSAYLLIAFVSFLFFGAADQSKFDLKWSEFLLDTSVKVQNKAGKTGAYLSEIIINRGFGIASFIFVYFMFITGFKILGRNLVSYSRSFIFSVLLVLWISITFGLVFSKTDAGSFMYMGGRYGFIMSNWLSSLIGKSGLVLLLFITALTLLVVRFEKAFAILKNMFRKKAKTEMPEKQEEEPDKEEVEDNSISKVIDDDDVVTAVFEPDTEEEKKAQSANLDLKVAKAEEEEEENWN